jgi:hypothetical protein
VAAKAGGRAPALVHLRFRDRRVTVRSGHRYTVTTPDGKVLANDVTLEQLKTIDPWLQQRLDQSVAGSGSFGWAGL